MQDKENLLAWISLSMLAGVANYLSQVTRQPKKFIWLHLFSHVASAALAGYIMGNLSEAYAFSNSVQMAIVGISGWAGPLILDESSKVLSRMLPEMIARGNAAIYMMVKPPEDARKQYESREVYGDPCTAAKKKVTSEDAKDKEALDKNKTSAEPLISAREERLKRISEERAKKT